jgi:hypothetical protein
VPAAKIGGGAIFFSLFFVSILAFAIRVYPFIPAFKGGGDYRKSAATVRVKPSANLGVSLPTEVVIIEETPASLFIALPRQIETNGIVQSPTKKGIEANWRLWKDLPQVLEVPRDAIASVQYKPPGNKAKKH